MTDEEFRKLYCWLIEYAKPPFDMVERVLKNVLIVLQEKRREQDRISFDCEKVNVNKSMSGTKIMKAE